MKQINKKELKKILELHEKWRRDEVDGERADLRGANLWRADFGGVDLRRVDLRRADLGGANLRRADLRGADLRGVDFWRADLGGADLGGADLRGADLGGANLRRANLGGADLRRAIYSTLNIFQIDWGKLSDKMTLELMRHDAEFIGEKLINEWAYNDGLCPCVGKSSDFIFVPKREVWKPGKPKLRGRKLFEALAGEINLKI